MNHAKFLCRKCHDRQPRDNFETLESGHKSTVCNGCKSGQSTVQDTSVFTLPKRGTNTRLEYLTGLGLFNLCRKACSNCGRDFSMHRTNCTFCQTYCLCIYTDEVREIRLKQNEGVKKYLG